MREVCPDSPQAGNCGKAAPHQSVADSFPRGSLFVRDLALRSSVNDDRKLVSLQGSAADQAAVNIGLTQQLLGILRVHAAAVLDGQALGSVLAVQLANDLADSGADLLGLISGSGLAGADGPDGP